MPRPIFPPTEQVSQEPAHSHVIGPLPQVFSMQRADSVSPAVTAHSWPGGQVVVEGYAHCTSSQAPTLTCQTPFSQVTTLRPAPEQSS